MIKLIAIDLDGTLFDSRSKISQKNINAIKDCLSMGVRVVITTAKTVYWVKKLIKSLGLKDPQIASAGAAIIDLSLMPVYIKKIPRTCFFKMVMLSRENSVGLGVSCLDGYVYYENENPSLKHIWDSKERPKYAPDLLDRKISEQVLLVTATVDPDDAFNEILVKELDAKVNIRRAGQYFLTAYNKNTGKTKALKKILKICGIRKNEVMAIGDSESDLGMINLASIGVAMGNAPENVKSAADFVSKDNDSDGVYEAIEKFVLKKT
ncbi:MAG: Cof-type HAD-IIB family hydrolase [Actinobacteria bacterium]|nr:Cof-type HAD-IIB family hydrolase [Actinomycetota bacterium]